MITTNTNGNPISQGFINEIKSDTPNVIARLWYNNAELPCDIASITVEKGSCGQQTFMIGDAIGDMLKATVKNLNTDIKGERIECHIGAFVNGAYEYVSLGIFKVSEVKKTRYQSEITAYSGVVSDSGNVFDSLSLTNPTIAELAIRLKSDLGCEIYFDSGIDTTQVIKAQLTGITDYQALQILAICSGGYVVNRIDGDIEVKRFKPEATVSVDTGMMVKLPVIAEQPYKVRNVGVVASEPTVDNEGNEVEEVYYTLNSQEYIKVIKQGTAYYLEDENGNRIIANARPDLADLYFQCFYMTEDMFNANIKTIVGYEYYPADIHLTLGDPRIEGTDVLAVTEVDGQVYNVPCHKVIHKYTGGFVTEVRSADANNVANDIGSSAPITVKLQSMSRQTGKAQATADNAYRIADNTNQYFWFRGTGTDTGAHITEVPQEQWDDSGSPYYHSGGNLLARSNGVAVRKGLVEVAVFSQDGVSINEDGSLVAQFGSTAQIGKSSANHVSIGQSSIDLYKGSTRLGSFAEYTSGTGYLTIYGANGGGTHIYPTGFEVFGPNNTDYAFLTSHYLRLGYKDDSGGVSISQYHSSDGSELLSISPPYLGTLNFEVWGTIKSTGGITVSNGEIITSNGRITATNGWVYANGGLLSSNANGNQVNIGSQNSSFCHIYNTANIPFIFNRTVTTESGNLGTSDYPWGNLYMSGNVVKTSTPDAWSQTYDAVWHKASDSSHHSICRPSSSSIRYKEDIKPVEKDILDPHNLYDISVVQFKYKEGYFHEDDEYNKNRYDVIGFIAEDVNEHYPIATIKIDGEVENWDSRYIIPPMLALIQEQHEEIEKLKEEVYKS